MSDLISRAFAAREKINSVIALSEIQAQSLSDDQAKKVCSLYPEWEPDKSYGGDGQIQIVSRPDGNLYRCWQAHTSQAGREPENAPALWAAIAPEDKKGTQEDPIQAVRGMEYTYGLYYLDPEDGKTYLCQRTGEAEEGKVVLQYLPHELIGHYFAEA